MGQRYRSQSVPKLRQGLKPLGATAASAVADFGGRRFLVPQYEEAAKD